MRGLFSFIGTILKLLGSFLLFYYFYLFLKWYIKGHFGRHFIWFWLWSCFSTYIYFSEKARIEKQDQEYRQKWGNKTGQEFWEEKMKDYDPVRGW